MLEGINPDPGHHYNWALVCTSSNCGIPVILCSVLGGLVIMSTKSHSEVIGLCHSFVADVSFLVLVTGLCMRIIPMSKYPWDFVKTLKDYIFESLAKLSNWTFCPKIDLFLSQNLNKMLLLCFWVLHIEDFIHCWLLLINFLFILHRSARFVPFRLINHLLLSFRFMPNTKQDTLHASAHLGTHYSIVWEKTESKFNSLPWMGAEVFSVWRGLLCRVLPSQDFWRASSNLCFL